jgi:hypothetical protein
VGLHAIETSPFQDLRGKQALTVTAGVHRAGQSDPAGVGPRTGTQVSSLRYELLLTGPLWLLDAHDSYAPSAGSHRTRIRS